MWNDDAGRQDAIDYLRYRIEEGLRGISIREGGPFLIKGEFEGDEVGEVAVYPADLNQKVADAVNKDGFQSYLDGHADRILRGLRAQLKGNYRQHENEVLRRGVVEVVAADLPSRIGHVVTVKVNAITDRKRTVDVKNEYGKTVIAKDETDDRR